MIVPYQAGLSNRWWISLRQILLHMCVTVLAIGIAFSLPVGARYILYQWWPVVAEDATAPGGLRRTMLGLVAPARDRLVIAPEGQR